MIPVEPNYIQSRDHLDEYRVASKAVSVVSAPPPPTFTSSPEDIMNVSHLASSLFQRGELRNAEVLYIQVYKAMTLREAIGATHFRTLTAMNLRARCLAYNGDHKDAASLASGTYETIARTLGRRHPLALESMDCLVHIYRAQHCFAQAIATAKSLVENSRKTLGPEHPQTTRASYQVAASHLANGDYYTSESGFQAVVKCAEISMGKNNPETLKYTSKLACALLKTGQIDEAWEIAVNVAKRQVVLYWKPQVSPH
ncbi:uncharacterized protein BCR38DRAFT_351588 [Pseudomassariella vexata]|uniref:Tetratricopeptide repeat-domain-containing protein n=1 Tax=Pseudomassariella vexata TaxID=1141098 RepID=A0A1Y2DKJ8_9PEZI|nr:uncharacterized protein BCR38DRAFT_351588 [Pseudomassariella vexata]ORY59285.1 hypothetical protein BCR38DRAFT_351588 [Pseudomassariella vexata]